MKKFSVFVAVLLVLFVGVWTLAIFTRAKSPLSGDVSEDPALIARGQQLAIQGDCTACHTKKGGTEYFAGGYAFPLPMGTIYSPNISPDAKDGIGNWTLAEFDDAVRFGVSKRLGNLYPAMPYVSYTKISDDDVKALYAYFKFGVKPMTVANKEATIDWPLNIRWPVQLWNDMFAPRSRYVADDSKSEQWNRGAYLVEGLAHCGTCHTPRGIAMQEIALDQNTKGYLGGSKLAGMVAFNITSDPQAGIGPWSEDQLKQFLKTGNVKNLAQAGLGMGEAVEHSFSHMTPDDIAAIATYVKTVPAYDKGDKVQRSSLGKPVALDGDLRGANLAAPFNDKISVGESYKGSMIIASTNASDAAAIASSNRGQTIFMGACATCHQWSGSGVESGYYPSLFKNSVVGTSDPSNLTQVILHGLKRATPESDTLMPSFGEQLSNEEIADLVNYVKTSFGDGSEKMTAEKVNELRQ